MTKTRYELLKGRLLRKAWFITGAIKYNFCYEALTLVLQKHRDIGSIPRGYCYPELIMKTEIPLAMLTI